MAILAKVSHFMSQLAGRQKDDSWLNSMAKVCHKLCGALQGILNMTISANQSFQSNDTSPSQAGASTQTFASTDCVTGGRSSRERSTGTGLHTLAQGANHIQNASPLRDWPITSESSEVSMESTFNAFEGFEFAECNLEAFPWSWESLLAEVIDPRM